MRLEVDLQLVAQTCTRKPENNKNSTEYSVSLVCTLSQNRANPENLSKFVVAKNDVTSKK